MKKLLVILVGLVLIGSQPVFSQNEEGLKALKIEIETIKEGQKKLQTELELIKELLRGRLSPPSAQPQNVVLTIEGQPYKGNKDAPLTLIEFADYQCPFCARHFRETLPEIERD